ncbi:MAG: DNA starvation/stationary phase protection protein [Atopobiaceae bacterium]|nr:DNA starvation/stationary phase protection protein [Atopobiaceae bacterium]
MLNDKLNALLANYVAEFHKLQTYHWYVKGTNFFGAHVKLEEYYDAFFEGIDEIAEKMLMIGAEPIANMKEFSELTTIEEAKAEFIDDKSVFENVKADFEALLAQVTELKAAADDEDNVLISAFADEIIANLAKNIWMIGQMLA